MKSNILLITALFLIRRWFIIVIVNWEELVRIRRLHHISKAMINEHWTRTLSLWIMILLVTYWQCLSPFVQESNSRYLPPVSWLTSHCSFLLVPGSWLLSLWSFLLSPGFYLLANISLLLSPDSLLLAPVWRRRSVGLCNEIIKPVIMWGSRSEM